MSNSDIVHGLLFTVHAEKIEDLEEYRVRSLYECPDGGYVLLPQSARTLNTVEKFARFKFVVLTGDRVFPFLYEGVASKSVDVAEILFDWIREIIYTDERTVSGTLGRDYWGFKVKSLAKSPVPSRSFTSTTDTDSLEVWRRILPFGVNLPLRRDDEGILLHVAASRNDVALIKQLLTHKANVNARLRDGCTPLHVAADLGHAPAATLLLQNGAGVEERAVNGTMPMHAAARSGHLSVCKVLLAHGADVHAKVKTYSLLRNATPLHLAIESGNAELVSFLLINGADANGTGHLGSSPLQIAVDRGCPRVCNIILNHGAHAADRRNKAAFRTALRRGAVEMKPIVERMHGGGHAVTTADARDAALLHGVARLGCDELLRKLLELGADTNAVACKTSRKTLLHVATERSAVDMLQLLVHHGADPNVKCSLGRTPLFYAAVSGRADLATILIQAGASVTSRDTEGETILSAVCAHDMPEMATLLLESGADPNDGAPVVSALKRGHNKVVEVLCKFGARGDVPDKLEWTALHVAAKLVDTELLKIFIKNSSDLDCGHGRTPLVDAVSSYSNPPDKVLEVAKLLLRHGADPNKGSPIIIAARRKRPKVVEILCQFGARVDSEADGDTALSEAAGYGDVETVKVLIRYGADVDGAGNRGSSPLSLAVYRNELDVVKVLSEFGSRLDQPESPWRSVLLTAAEEYNFQILRYLLEYNFRDSMSLIKSPNFVRTFRSIMGESRDARYCLLNFVFKMEVADAHADPNKVHDANSNTIHDIVDRYSNMSDEPEDCRDDLVRFVDCQLGGFHDTSYLNELQKMKETYVGSSPWTLHDLFTKSVHRLAGFARNEEFAKAAESATWFVEDLDEEQREIGLKYGRILGYQHQKACQRRELIDGALLVSRRLFTDVTLPVEIVEDIFSYLSARDLLVFQTACSPVPSD